MYLSVQQRHFLDISMLNHVHHTRILSNTAHADSVRVVAPQVLHEDVRRVRLRREAVVADVHACVGHSQPVEVERVEAVCVFR